MAKIYLQLFLTKHFSPKREVFQVTRRRKRWSYTGSNSIRRGNTKRIKTTVKRNC
jgi:hypothetical protein